MIHNISRFITALALLATAQGAWAQTPSGNWDTWVSENNIDWESADAKAAAIPQSEDGSTVYISTAEQLAYYAYAVNNDKQISGSASGYYCGRTVELLADIDLSAHYWTPIGTNSSYYFNGFFHGNGHVISGMNIKLSSTDNGITCIGLFGHIRGRNSGTGTTSITNLTLKDFSVSNTTNPTNHIYVGGLVGHCNKNGTTTSITNCCLINGTVYSDGAQRFSLGGLVAGGTPTTCANNYRYNVSTTARNDETVHYPISGESVANCATLTVGTHGSVAIGGSVGVITDGKIYAASGQTVTLSDTPDAGYMVGYTASGVTVTSGAFTMPANDDATVAATFAPDPAHFSQSGDEYTIHTATGWGVFCDLIADGESFSGKTVSLDADITVTRMAGSGDNPFCGNFDGGGNTLTFTADAADNYCAPFVSVKGGTTADDATTISNLNVVTTITANDYRHMAGLIALQWGHVNVSGCNATVNISSTVGTSNPHDLYPAGLVSQASSDNGGTLTVTGCIASGTISTDGKYAAGLVGIVQGTASISDCISSVTIDSSTSGDGTHGGIVAVVNGSGTITGSVFNGKLLTTGETATGNCAGFIAWGNGSISNCLYAPAAIEGDEAEVVAGTGDYPSGTFYRGTAPSVSNCYYTRTLGTVQGKATRTVTAADEYTTVAVALTGDATEYNVSGITAYSGGGLQLGETLYYGSGDAVSLTLSNTATGAPAGYQYAGYTASAGTLDDNNILTMPDDDVTISVALAPIDWATVNLGNSEDPYMIYNKDQLDLLAHRVNGTHGETCQTDGYEDTYFQLANDIKYTHKADGEEGADAENNYEAIGGYYDGYYRSFCGHFNGNNKTISGIRIYKDGNGDADWYQGIFGRTYGADIHDLTLADARITGYDRTGGIVGYNIGGTVTHCHVAGDVAVCAVQPNARYHGGIVGYNTGTIEQCTSAATLTIADATSTQYYGGIAGYNSSRGTLRDNLAIGATVPATADNTYGAITGYNGRTLLRNYYAACNVANVENATGVGCGYIDDGNGGYITADVNNDNNPDGAVCINTLALTANQAPDGNYWTTYYNSALGFTIDADENACAYTATYSGSQLTLHNLGKEIPKNTAVIIVADNGVVSMTAATVLPAYSGTNDLRGVDYDTPVANIRSDLGEGTLYVLGMTTVDNEKHFGFHRYTGEEMAAHKAFVFVGGSQAARSLTMVFDEATGISDATRLNNKEEIKNNNWFTLDGRRLQAKPTAPGIYVNNGKKVVIK